MSLHFVLLDVNYKLLIEEAFMKVITFFEVKMGMAGWWNNFSVPLTKFKCVKYRMVPFEYNIHPAFVKSMKSQQKLSRKFFEILIYLMHKNQTRFVVQFFHSSV